MFDDDGFSVVDGVGVDAGGSAVGCAVGADEDGLGVEPAAGDGGGSSVRGLGGRNGSSRFGRFPFGFRRNGNDRSFLPYLLTGGTKGTNRPFGVRLERRRPDGFSGCFAVSMRVCGFFVPFVPFVPRGGWNDYSWL